MKFLAVVALILLGRHAFAGSTTFSVEKNPVVIDSDLTLNPGAHQHVIKAPWADLNVSVSNPSNEAAQVSEIDVVCAGGTNFYHRIFNIDWTVGPVGSGGFHTYLDALPAVDHHCSCSATLMWSNTEGAHLETFELVTQ